MQITGLSAFIVKSLPEEPNRRGRWRLSIEGVAQSGAEVDLVRSFRSKYFAMRFGSSYLSQLTGTRVRLVWKRMSANLLIANAIRK